MNKEQQPIDQAPYEYYASLSLVDIHPTSESIPKAFIAGQRYAGQSTTPNVGEMSFGQCCEVVCKKYKINSIIEPIRASQMRMETLGLISVYTPINEAAKLYASQFKQRAETAELALGMAIESRKELKARVKELESIISNL